MRRITVRVPVEDLGEILETPGRACVSYTAAGRPVIEPVSVRHDDGRYLVAFPHGAPRPHPGDEVVLVVDEGVLFFHLRAVYVRGRLAPAPEKAGSHWHAIEPILTSAWDYSRMRVSDED